MGGITRRRGMSHLFKSKFVPRLSSNQLHLCEDYLIVTATDRVTAIQQRLSPLQASLFEHPIYGEINSIGKLHIFMQHHVFAVWDFMSLLKMLQKELCGHSVPWLPPADRTLARLVNEIVLGEESDEDGESGFASHFELYLRAMRRCGANTDAIDYFANELRRDSSIESALSTCSAPACVRQFVLHTFQMIGSGDPCIIASAFTFGREALLPDVFQRIVDELNVETCGGLDDFVFYLNRHIELDGDHHGPMAAQMIARLCGSDDAKWQAAERAAVQSLQARKALWDGTREAMRESVEAKIA